MAKKIGREIVLLALPAVLLLGVGWMISSKPKANSIVPILVTRWAPDSTRPNYFRPHLTIELNRSWMESRAPMELNVRSWILDADGQVISKQNGYGFNPVEESTNRYIFDPGLYISPKQTVKEPLTFQAVLQIHNRQPVEINCLLPLSNVEEKPRPSKFPFQKYKF